MANLFGRNIYEVQIRSDERMFPMYIKRSECKPGLVAALVRGN